MNSFIYEDQELLNKLFVIAQQQQQAPTNTDQLKNTALQLINNLKQELSSIKANSNPTFKDLKDLNSFKEWVKSSGAAFNGKQIDEGNGPTVDGLSALLLDLRKKAAGKGLYGESVANLIYQLNQNTGVKLDPFEPATNQQATKNMLLAVKTPENVENQEQQSAQNKPAPAVVSGVTLALSLLNGNIVNVDSIFKGITNCRNFFKSIPDLYLALGGSADRAFRAMGNFITATVKSPGQYQITATPSDDPLELVKAIESTFQTASGKGYNSIELRNITMAFYYMVMEVINFYAILKSAKELSQYNGEFEEQTNMAKSYADHLKKTVPQFIGQ